MALNGKIQDQIRSILLKRNISNLSIVKDIINEYESIIGNEYSELPKSSDNESTSSSDSSKDNKNNVYMSSNRLDHDILESIICKYKIPSKDKKSSILTNEKKHSGSVIDKDDDFNDFHRRPSKSNFVVPILKRQCSIDEEDNLKRSNSQESSENAHMNGNLISTEMADDTYVNRERRPSIYSSSTVCSLVFHAKTESDFIFLSNALSQNILCRLLNTRQKKEVVDVMKPRHIPSGTVIIREGDIGDEMYIVGQGELIIYKDSIKNISPNQSENNINNAKSKRSIKTNIIDKKLNDTNHLNIANKKEIFIEEKENPNFQKEETSMHSTNVLSSASNPFNTGFMKNNYIEVDEVETTDDTFPYKILQKKTRGDLVGELAILHFIHRTANVKAISDVMLWVITQEEYFTITTGERMKQMEILERVLLNHSFFQKMRRRILNNENVLINDKNELNKCKENENNKKNEPRKNMLQYTEDERNLLIKEAKNISASPAVQYTYHLKNDIIRPFQVFILAGRGSVKNIKKGTSFQMREGMVLNAEYICETDLEGFYVEKYIVL